mgnify:FL=1
MSHRRTSDPDNDAVPLQSVLDHSLVTNPSEASYMQTLLGAAIASVEEFIERSLITQTWELKLDSWEDARYTRLVELSGGCERAIIVPRPPLLAVSSIQYIDSDGNTQTLAASKYDVDTASHPGRITLAVNQSWPSLRDVPNAVTITHTAGYGTLASSIPEPIRLAIRMLVAHWYYMREPVLT